MIRILLFVTALVLLVATTARDTQPRAEAASFDASTVEKACALGVAPLAGGKLPSLGRPCSGAAPWLGMEGGVAGAGDASISGTVTEEGSGSPMANACVFVVDEDGVLLAAAARADVMGAYSASGLAAGNYKVGFVDCSPPGFHRPEFYDDKPDLVSADVVTVASGQLVEGIDAALAAGGGSISGTVTEAGTGMPLADVCVYVYDNSDELAGAAITDASGAYTAGGLDAGAHTVSYQDCERPEMHVSEWYDGSLDAAGADDVPVSAGMKTAAIDATLARGAYISGSVREEQTHTSLSGICVEAYDASSFELRSASRTGASGEYTLGGVASGSYQVQFYDCVAPLYHIAEWYNGEPDVGAADLVHVGDAGSTRSGINATLAAGGSIRGRVTEAGTGDELPSICIFSYEAVTEEGFASDVTDASGEYEVGGLLPGSYKVYFSDCAPTQTYGGQWYNRQSGVDSATIVTVTLRHATAGVDGLLERGALISGRVTTEESGSPLADICITAYDVRNLGGFGTTEGDGTYRIAVPANGSYAISFSDCSDEPSYNSEWYNNEQLYSAADSVRVRDAGTKVWGINAGLSTRIAGDANCNRVVNAIDAVIVLQYGAGLLFELPCWESADVNRDGDWTAIDAALILQYEAGLLHNL